MRILMIGCGMTTLGLASLAAVFLYFYPITEQKYKEIQAGIAEMEAKKASFPKLEIEDIGGTSP
jgi:Na+/melibiose symporter-like transporter